MALRLIIAGSRALADCGLRWPECHKCTGACTRYSFIDETIDSLNLNDPIVICGMAKGADLLGLRYAKEHNLRVEKYPAEWDKFGRSAGYKRNQKMAEVADIAVVFRVGGAKSKGSTHMINIMQELGKRVVVVEV